MDSTSNGRLDEGETIYKENDNETVGDHTFGDRLTTVTVRNNGTLPDAEIERITLLANGTEIANTTSARNGTWVLQPDPADAFFGPPGDGTEFTLETTLADNATAGETVELWIPPANDSGTTGVYDPGDSGLFFEQDSPTGDIGPGTTLSVEADEDSSDGGSSESSEPEPVAIGVRLETTNLTTAAPAIPVTIETNATNRTFDVALRYQSNNSTVATRTVTSGPAGQANVSFDTRPGRFRVLVADAATGTTASTDGFTIDQPTAVRFLNDSYSVRRGEVADLGVTLRNADLAAVTLEGPTGRLLSVAGITNASDVARDRLRVDTAALGQGRADPGIRTARNATETVFLNESSVDGDAPGSVPRPAIRNRTLPSTSNPPPGVIPPRPGRPLGAGRYEVSLHYNRTVTDTATIRVTAEWSGSVQTLVAPAGAPLDSAERIRELATPRSEIAAGDRLVLAVNATGLEGYGLQPRARNRTVKGAASASNASESPVRTGNGTAPDERSVANETGVVDGDQGNATASNRSAAVESAENRTSTGTGAARNDSTRVPAEERSGGGVAGGPARTGVTRAPGAFASVGPAGEGLGPPRGLPAVAFRRIPDPDTETVYLVAPRGANLSESLQPGQRYGAAFVLNESSPFVPGLSTSEDVERESIRRNFTAVAPVANFSSVSADGSLDLEPAAGVPVNGTTTVAPGTVLTVRLNGSDPDAAFTVESQATVAEDGTYETDLDLDDYESSTNYTVSVTADGERISPLRTGQLTETQSDGSAAAAGAGGGGSPAQHGPDEGSSDGIATTETETTGSPPSEETTERDWVRDIRDFDPIPGGSLPEVPPPLRLGTESLVALFLGVLALLAVGLGVRRLL